MRSQEEEGRQELSPALLRHLLDLEVEVLLMIALAMQLQDMAARLLRMIDALQRPLFDRP
jgi:hypothetical protein